MARQVETTIRDGGSRVRNFWNRAVEKQAGLTARPGELSDNAMNVAFVHGKSVEEDQLTSDIFGLLKYVSPLIALWPLLKEAESFDEGDHFKLIDQLDLSEPKSSKYFFWPSAGDREPDLLIILSDSLGTLAALVVEVKLASGKHNLEIDSGFGIAVQQVSGNGETAGSADVEKSDGDQLRDYFCALMDDEISLTVGRSASVALAAEIEAENRKDQETLRLVPKHKRFRLYLTDDDSLPRDEVKDTLKSLTKSPHSHDSTGRLCWVGWRSLYEAAERALNNSNNLEEPQRTILRDILLLLDLRNLRPFKGWNGLYSDASRSNEGSVLFWHRRWFRDISSSDTEVGRSFHFWRETAR